MLYSQDRSNEQDRWQTALEAANVGVWDYNPQTGALTWSNKCYEFFGLAPGTPITLDTFWKGLHPDDYQNTEKEMQAAMNPDGNGEFQVEYRTIGLEDQQPRWVRATGKTYFNGSGEAIRFIGTVSDVSERKAAEEALHFRTALLEAQQETSADGILITDGNDKILYANRRFAELWNMPRHIIEAGDNKASLAYGMNQLVNTEEAIKHVEYLYENPHQTVEDELVFKNGKILERRARAVTGRDGTYYGWAWYFRDITERRQSEQRLQQKNGELQNLIAEFKFVTDFLPQMLWASQPDGNLDFFNQQWLDYSGSDFEASKGYGWVQWLHPDDVDRTLAAWSRSLQSGDTYDIEFRLRRYDGVYRWHLTRALPLRSEGGAISKWYGATTDIHDQKTQEELLEQKVNERTAALQEVNKRLESSNTELEQFAYIASHDLQEPLRKIRTFINMFQREMEGGSMERSQLYMEKIVNASDRMNTLIKDLLEFSRATRASENAFEMTNLNAILKDALEDLELMISQKKATIEFDPLPRLRAVPTQMGQLFYNLINNSLKFSKEEEPPRISIRCRELPPGSLAAYPTLPQDRLHYELVFQDNGIGFGMEYADQVFTIFQRLNARSSYEGTGIGLAICKKIVASHHGEIFARAEEGKGAEFFVVLPGAGNQ